jgi:hypothetical protein
MIMSSYLESPGPVKGAGRGGVRVGYFAASSAVQAAAKTRSASASLARARLLRGCHFAACTADVRLDSARENSISAAQRRQAQKMPGVWFVFVVVMISSPWFVVVTRETMDPDSFIVNTKNALP